MRPLTLLYFINFLSLSFLTWVLLTFRFKSLSELNRGKFKKLEYLDELGKKPGIIDQSYSDYILNPGFSICGGDYGHKVKILAMVLTSPENYDRRFIVRNTWGSKNVYPKQLKVLFLLGKSKNETANLNLR